MADWLTTHYPRPPGDPERYEIYLQDEHEHAADGIAVGDRVWFYEFATARPVKGGKSRPPRGRQGVVHFACVTGPIYERDRVIEYTDGSLADWRWGIPTDVGESGGFVDRKKLCTILGHRQRYTFRGFAGGAGLKRLDDEEAVRLMRAFRGGTPPFRVPVKR